MTSITAQSAGLAVVVAFAAGLLVGASLVAVALARREASLTSWAARLQRREAHAATATGPDRGSVTPVSAPAVPRPRCIGRKVTA